ncbi:aminodeoxychorismate synthase component I [Desulfobacter curvatus]|uniref:aminodeoxychorismate synthase component I n=1 Tax=Desulfobacter curvatus TaxID=2290 RepID=UPI00037B9B4B|nr:aminodeoxychorismate synthase component I [Desulfobacter curvatus]
MSEKFFLPRITDVVVRGFNFDLPFEHAAARFCRQEGTVVLLSGSDLDCARYHILAADPWLTIKGTGNTICINVKNSAGDFICHETKQDPFGLVDALIKKLSFSDKTFKLPVAAGLFGYFSYDLKDKIEELPQTCMGRGLPDICLYAPSVILIQDRKTGENRICLPMFDGDKKQKEVLSREKSFLKRLEETWQPGSFCTDGTGLVSSFAKPEYLSAVSQIIAHLKQGDIYQANLSQRFETGFRGDAYALFLKLFEKNPAPFFAFVQAGDHQVVSSSPERFLKVEGKTVETRPIKGTIARGKTPEQDRENEKMLSQSTKDDAELTMIVDLMRNDLSRVTEHDSVEVTAHKRLEPYDNVFHLVSVIEGRLKTGVSCAAVVRAAFPGGSITGCPKIRSMEIIDALEPVKRHVYTGSIGYLSFHGTMDLSIAIRTAVIHDGRLSFSVGGGVVYDSDPQQEFEETLVKGKTLMDTLVQGAAQSIEKPVMAWVNGRFVPQHLARVPADIPGFLYGAGLFETIRVDAGIPIRLSEHIRRLEQSWMSVFGGALPDICWESVIRELISQNGFEQKTCAVKLVAAKDHRPGRCVLAAAFIRTYVHRLEQLGKKGLDLVTFPHARHSFLADHKSMNYLFYDLARTFALAHGADEALILNPDGTVSETNTCNILGLDGKNMVVPASGHVLNGVTIRSVMQIMAQRGFSVSKVAVDVEIFCALPYVFVTNALMGMVPVRRINNTILDMDNLLCSQVNEVLFSSC